MPETTEVATQPAVTQQTSVEKGKNITAASVAAMLLQRSKPKQEAEATTTADAPDTPEEGLPEVQEEVPQDQQLEAEQSTEEPQNEVAQPEESEADVPSSSTDKKLSPELQKILDKRIGKEVAKRKALEDELARVKSTVEAAKQSPQQQQEQVSISSSDSPLAHINDFKSLEQAEQEARDIKDLAREWLDSDNIDNGVQYGDRVFTKQQVKDILRNAEKTIEREIPKRQKFIQQRAQAEQVAAKFSPWMADKSSNEYTAFQQAFKNKAYLNQDPESPYFVALAMKGLAVLQKEIADAGKAKPAVTTAKPPASQTAASGAGTRPKVNGETAAARQVAADRQAILSKGNLKASDVSALLRKTASIKPR